MTVDSDVVEIVYQLIMENGAYKFALDANVIEITRLKAAMKSNVDGTKTGLEIRVTEYIRQITELGHLQTAAETYSETMKRENEILKKYMSDLQRSIGEMSFVLDETIDENMVKADEMKIHRPDALVDDELTRVGKAFVLGHIAKFEDTLRELLMIQTERARYQTSGEVLGNVVQDMSGLLSATISGGEIRVIRPLNKKWNLDENLKALNGKMTTAIGQFEGSIDTFTEQKKRQESEVTTLKIVNGKLEERVGSQKVTLDALTQPSVEQVKLIASQEEVLRLKRELFDKLTAQREENEKKQTTHK